VSKGVAKSLGLTERWTLLWLWDSINRRRCPVSIKSGDRVLTIEGKVGKVEMWSDDGNMAYVWLDENSESDDYSQYEIDRLTKIDAETILPTTQ
jgi:hypothetical protein